MNKKYLLVALAALAMTACSDDKDDKNNSAGGGGASRVGQHKADQCPVGLVGTYVLQMDRNSNFEVVRENGVLVIKDEDGNLPINGQPTKNKKGDTTATAICTAGKVDVITTEKDGTFKISLERTPTGLSGEATDPKGKKFTLIYDLVAGGVPDAPKQKKAHAKERKTTAAPQGRGGISREALHNMYACPMVDSGTYILRENPTLRIKISKPDGIKYMIQDPVDGELVVDGKPSSSNDGTSISNAICLNGNFDLVTTDQQSTWTGMMTKNGTSLLLRMKNDKGQVAELNYDRAP